MLMSIFCVLFLVLLFSHFEEYFRNIPAPQASLPTPPLPPSRADTKYGRGSHRLSLVRQLPLMQAPASVSVRLPSPPPPPALLVWLCSPSSFCPLSTLRFLLVTPAAPGWVFVSVSAHFLLPSWHVCLLPRRTAYENANWVKCLCVCNQRPPFLILPPHSQVL